MLIIHIISVSLIFNLARSCRDGKSTHRTSKDASDFMRIKKKLALDKNKTYFMINRISFEAQIPTVINTKQCVSNTLKSFINFLLLTASVKTGFILTLSLKLILVYKLFY